MSQALNNVRLSSPITVINGIGPKTARAFAKLNVFTVEDLLFLLPRRYEDRRTPKFLAELEEGSNECAIAEVDEIDINNDRTEAVISDETGCARVVWFTDKIGQFLKTGMRIAIYGHVNEFRMMLQFTHPEIEILSHNSQKPKLIGKIFPVYPGTAELSQRAIKKFVDIVIDKYSRDCLKEFLPTKILQHYGMMNYRDAVLQIHNPQDEMMFIRARNRLSFDELFLLQSGIIMRRKFFTSNSSAQILKRGEKYDAFMKNLPFKLTNAQKNSITEILSDMADTKPMNRLLQGDVGSGKTLVAVAAMLAASDSNAQAALMAPTEILAGQHYINLCRDLEPLGLNIGLLTGSLKTGERRKILDGISDGSIQIIIGTHAIFMGSVNFHNLALVIVDEQHRFGVLQRGQFISKGNSPHVLAMTATPIPRTLIMSVYGDLEVSVLNEMPPGRQKINTISLKPSERTGLLEFIRAHVKKGEQVYWVCPLIDDNEKSLSAVNSTYEYLCELMPDVKIAVLHGRLPVETKSRVMQEFAHGNIDMLVATVVIEVGVDVPNASLMIVQDAGQFGLAQLHQLRGRIGRGKAKSICILLENANITPEGLDRITTMVNISDGFELAEQDLIQRGPGEICGTHQHGVTDFHVADIVRDEKILTLARNEARTLLNEDPDLKSAPLMKREIIRRLGSVLEIATTS